MVAWKSAACMAQGSKREREPIEHHDIGLGTYYLGDSIKGAQRFLATESVDLIITDPPYGIQGDKLHRHYNRDERFVVGDYVEVREPEYSAFSRHWIRQAARILKPGGAIFIVSGYTNLYHILSALRRTTLEEVNHIIWRYSFGVYTRSKFVSSHYHILYYAKPGGKRVFKTESRYGLQQTNTDGILLNYRDRQDVWEINREYRPQQPKNKNSLPSELLIKILQYASSEGDLVCDLFMGGFTVARAAVGLNRRFVGFELSERAYRHHLTEMRSFTAGSLVEEQKVPELRDAPKNQWKAWTKGDLVRLRAEFSRLKRSGLKKKEIIARLMRQHRRGRWAIEHALKRQNMRYTR